jgi:heme A synthase
MPASGGAAVIRAVVVVAVLWAIWRKISRRRRYRLGLLATAGLAVIGACFGGVVGDKAMGGNSWIGEIVAGLGAALGAAVFVYTGEMLARRRPPPPPRKLRVPVRRKKR